MSWLNLLPLAAVVVSLSWALTQALFSRKRPLPPLRGRDPLVVFVVPCLNEEKVIGRTVERLLTMRGARTKVLVIDDGSTDNTAEAVRAVGSTDVLLLSRVLPDARLGKGQALNAAYRYLSTTLTEDPANVVVCVVDADGRLDPHTLIEVVPHFADKKIGAVQVGVRMTNVRKNMLTRFQDMEFVIFTELCQRARSKSGGAGMGGNGQFVRLQALQTLGAAPWTDCLTEDMDLGISLLLTGWKSLFCPTAFVHQQAVESPRRLVRQRARWFQGSLQCSRRVPEILKSRVSFAVAADFAFHLLAPFAVLAMGMYTISVISLAALAVVEHPHEAASLLFGGSPLRFLIAYFCAFGIAWIYAYVYWLRTPSESFTKAVIHGHGYVLYSFMWVLAGISAGWRMLRRKNSWAKTDRSADTTAQSDATVSVGV